ncbi:RNA polymerase sigma factor [Rhodobacter sp. KR11]|uniref:RNA polymerase sigma factor n=1 Tax=Rhodobacter sp. KR11 TaxID=2974588 RepID=UPI002221676E|nr:RNA polymerase sigma factor [Rhodobacter sp. KR11]MCW1919770.1 RNA polymerase sigma factor [Rhodobacter sp. KR11]
MIDLAAIWAQDRQRVLATLIRLLGDFDRAEEALHEAFLAAAEKWPRQGLPDNPFGWLVSAGRFRALDQMRREARMGGELPDLPAPELAPEWQDDSLRLIFTCCHPAPPPEAQVALTLRTVCGLATEDIARAFLIRPPALAQRIVRAKARIKALGLGYEIPEPSELPARLQAVLHVIYLVFNEGYLSAAAPRPDLSTEAIRLCRHLGALMQDGEVLGLLGLMLCHEARRQGRFKDGAPVALEDQDRGQWDHRMIAEGRALIERAFASGSVGPFTIQGAIAALHANAPSAGATDWAEIAGLYAVLERLQPSPVVRLNRAMALAMVRGPAAGLAMVQPLTQGPLANYRLAHLAEADLLTRLQRRPEAHAAYGRALALSSDAEKPAIEALVAKLHGA